MREKVYYFDPTGVNEGIFEVIDEIKNFGDKISSIIIVNDDGEELIIKEDDLQHIYPLNQVRCCKECGNTDLYAFKAVHISTKALVHDYCETVEVFCNKCDKDTKTLTLDKYVEHK